MLISEEEDTYHVILAKTPNVHGGKKWIFILDLTH